VKTGWADMRRLPFSCPGVDRMWPEGAGYIVGFERGLRKQKTGGTRAGARH